MIPKQKRLLQSFDRDTAVGSLGDTNQLDSFALLVRVLGEPNQRAWQASAAIQMLVHMDMRGCDSDDIMLELERLLGEGSPWVVALCPAADARGLVKGTLADTDSAASARLELLTWVTTDAISRRALDAVQVVGMLHDVGDIDTAADFKRAWNGFLRLYNLLQFLPECLCVTAQGVQDNAYQVLEFVHASAQSASPGDEAGAAWSAYAALVDAELLEALRQLAAHGVRLPDPACIPFELCGPHGNIIGQAELAWDDWQIAFVYADDTVSQQAFAHAGWTVRTVEELVAHPTAFVQILKGGND